MRSVLLAGCGFLGESAAVCFLEEGWQVTAMARDPERVEIFRETVLGPQGHPHFDVAAGDLTVVSSLPRGAFDVVVHCASSGRGGPDAYRAVFRDGARNLIATFPEARVIFVGSTSVYAQTDGSWVDESSETLPDRETGRILLEAEAAVTGAGGSVARLAGLYGPGRSVLMRKFLAGEAVLEDGGERWINQIHRDDAARALVRLADGPLGIFNVADDTPATQRQVYSWLAAHFDRPLPPSGPPDLDRKRGWTNKRVSNAKLRSLGWSPAFPSYSDFLTTSTGRSIAINSDTVTNL